MSITSIWIEIIYLRIGMDGSVIQLNEKDLNNIRYGSYLDYILMFFNFVDYIKI